jgi:hypothetical protein
MRQGRSVVAKYSMRSIVAITEYERYVIFAAIPSIDTVGNKTVAMF